jgi:hypothetical protein
MNERIMTRGFPWGEPAHPGVVKQYEDLLAIYGVIRAQLQSKIDDAFDRVSNNIGFVVSTTIPARLEIADKGKAAWSIGEHLKGSLFEAPLMEAMSGGVKAGDFKASAGTYNLYLIWYDALKLKLRKDWLEPVHFLRDELTATLAPAAAVRPEVQEPAHWFLPSATIAAEEKMVISAIDEVYPELRLADRVAATRQALRRVLPEVMEPAHPPGVAANLALREIGQLFKAVRPDIPEPAHFRLAERDILGQIQNILRKYGQ